MKTAMLTIATVLAFVLGIAACSNNETTAPNKPASMTHSHGSEATITASVTINAPLQTGRRIDAILRLRKMDGSPVLLADLEEVYTNKIHLLIIDQSLTDFRHEHPQPTHTPGEYSFSFTPQMPGSYRVWADVVPIATKIQEYAMADIAAEPQRELRVTLSGGKFLPNANPSWPATKTANPWSMSARLAQNP